MSQEVVIVLDRRQKFKVTMNRKLKVGDHFQFDGKPCIVSQVVEALTPPHIYLREQ